MKPNQFLLSLALFALLSCAQTSKPPFSEKTIIVGSKQTVEIKEIDFSITNEGCGRKWISDGDNPSYERPFCTLQISYRKENASAGDDRDTVKIQDLLLVVQHMNPWGREVDSIPPGGCRVWVKVDKP